MAIMVMIVMVMKLFWWDLLCNLTLSHFVGRNSKKTPCICMFMPYFQQRACQHKRENLSNTRYIKLTGNVFHILHERVKLTKLSNACKKRLRTHHVQPSVEENILVRGNNVEHFELFNDFLPGWLCLFVYLPIRWSPRGDRYSFPLVV